MPDSRDVPSLKLLTPVASEQLLAWLAEFYGSPVQITSRQLLRHRDLSFVERLSIADRVPNSIIYKLVLPPWDIEQDLHERVLIPSISNSAQLYMSAHHGELTALFLEDLGRDSLLSVGNKRLANQLGEELARLHRAYSYRIDELLAVGVLRAVRPADYEGLASELVTKISEWQLFKSSQVGKNILRLANFLATTLTGEPTSLVHGDLFAENVITRKKKLFIIDWSWFTIIGVPLMDVATLAMNHPKNGNFVKHKNTLIDAYCFESARSKKEILPLLAHAETLSRLFLLHWLVERRQRGIMGTTVGPVDILLSDTAEELSAKWNLMEARSSA